MSAARLLKCGLFGAVQTGRRLLLSFALMAMVRDTSMIGVIRLTMVGLIELGAY
jgi:hypothetical protein